MNSYRRPVNFKRRHVPRRHSKYTPKPKLNATVLFLTLFILAVIVGTVMLGNHLKSKVDEGKESSDTNVETKTEQSTPASGGISMIEPAEGNVRAGCLDISAITNEEDLIRRITDILASGYDAVTIPITKDNSLLYYSPAAAALSQLPADTNLPDLANVIKTVRETGENYGLTPTVTVYYKLTSTEITDPVLAEAAFLFDNAIVAEAHNLGADEVLISGFSLATSDDCDSILYFIEKLKTSAPAIKPGLSFTPDVYSVDVTAAYLEKLSAVTSFFAVDTSRLDWSYTVTEESVILTDENGDEIESTESVVFTAIYNDIINIATEIKGSISLYGLRFIINGENTYLLSEATEALYFKGAYDYYIVSAPEGGYGPDLPDAEETETDGEETDTENTDEE